MSTADVRALATQVHNLLGRLDHLEQTLAEYRDDHASVHSATLGVLAVLQTIALPVELHLLDEHVIFADRLLAIGPNHRVSYVRLRDRMRAAGQGGLRLGPGVGAGDLVAWVRVVLEPGASDVPLAARAARMGTAAAAALVPLAPRAVATVAATETHPRWLAVHGLLRAGRLAAAPGPLHAAAFSEAAAIATDLCSLPEEALRAALIAPRVEPPAGLRASRRMLAALVLAADLPADVRVALGALALLGEGRGSPPPAPDAELPGLLVLADQEPLAGALVAIRGSPWGLPAMWPQIWGGPVLVAATVWACRVVDGEAAAAEWEQSVPPSFAVDVRDEVRSWPTPP